MKAVFLDIDGVLNSEHWNESHHIEMGNGVLIDEEKVALLSVIIQTTQSTIVLHSGWRFWLDETLKPLRREAEVLMELLSKYHISIYDKTPDLSTDDIKRTKKFSLIKAKEILGWLLEHKEIDHYLVLDDLDLHNKEISEHQIRTDCKVGLTSEDVELANSFLFRGSS